jgi:hypothetical protein
MKVDKNEIYAKIADRELSQKIYQIELEKKEKNKKYRNF